MKEKAGGTFSYRCVKHFDQKIFLDDLANQPWSVVQVFDDPNDSYYIGLGLHCSLVW